MTELLEYAKIRQYRPIFKGVCLKHIEEMNDLLSNVLVSKGSRRAYLHYAVHGRVLKRWKEEVERTWIFVLDQSTPQAPTEVAPWM